MKSIDESQLAKLSVKELFQYRMDCADNWDIESLLSIAKYRFIKGAAATIESILPEMAYYYGRLHRGEELQVFLSDKQAYLFMLTQSCMELSQNLLNIGYRFPHLNESEIEYLEEKYCDSKTFELFDIIMFDSDRLPRPIKKFDKELLKRVNSNFSKVFLLEVYECFSKNEEIDQSYDELYIYSRIENRIIRKKYSELGLGEYCILHPIHSNEFWKIMHDNYGSECADYFAQELAFDDDLDGFKNSDFIMLNVESIEDVANEYFSDSSIINELKTRIALLWLNRINSDES